MNPLLFVRREVKPVIIAAVKALFGQDILAIFDVLPATTKST